MTFTKKNLPNPYVRWSPKSDKRLFFRRQDVENFAHLIASMDTISLYLPYVGPRAFNSDETLYGRNQEVRDLLNILIARRIVLLYSPSGAGKTSLIQAALTGELEKEGFRVLPVMRPGLESPPDVTADANRYVLSILMCLNEGLPPEKAASLPDLAQLTLGEFLQHHSPGAEESGNEVLIFDQFEEILTHDPTDEDAKKEFFRQVGEVLENKNRWALFAMREEYVAGLDPYLRAIPTRLKANFRLELLGLEAARQAIQEPARAVGGEFTDAAANQLVKDLSTVYVPGKEGIPELRGGFTVEPVQLQVVCQRLWKRYGDDLKIDANELQDLGDINTALADYYAEHVAEVARSGKASERRVREWVQTNLLTKHGFRGQVMKELEKTEGLENQAIQILVDAHLIREDPRGTRTYYELAHDRLLEPIRENNEAWFQKNLSTLQLKADFWNRQGRLYDLLLTGGEYANAKQWADSYQGQLTDVEKDFLKRSWDKIRQNRIRNTFIGLAFGALILLLIGTFYVFATIKRNEESRRLADQQKRLALAGQYASSAFSQLFIDPERSILLALESVAEALTLEQPEVTDQKLRQRTKSAIQLAENALHRAMFTSRIKAAVFQENQAPEETAYEDKVSQIVFSPDSQRIAIVQLDKNVKVWDAATKRFLHPPSEVKVNWASFDQDGSRLALACEDAITKIWDLNNPKIIPIKHDRKAVRVYFNKQGTYLATVIGGIEGKFNVWKADNFEGNPLMAGEHRDLQDLAFSPDGNSIATVGWDGNVLLWQVPSVPTQIVKMKDFAFHKKTLKRVCFSPKGTMLATVSLDDGLVKVWKVSSGEQLWEGKAFGLEVAFSPDEKFLALASKFSHVMYVLEILDIPLSPAPLTPSFPSKTTFAIKAILTGHAAPISKLLFLPPGKSPQSNFLVSASEDETVKMWDLSTSKEIYSLIGHQKPVKDIAFYPDPENKGNRLVSVGSNGKVRVWDISIGHTAFVNKVAFDSTGAWVATASNDGTARMWSAKDGHEHSCIGPDCHGISAMGYSLNPDQGRISAMAFSHKPDKEKLVTATNDGTLTFWTDGKKPARRRVCNDILGVILPNEPAKIKKMEDITFSPHGKYVAVRAVVGFSDRYRSQIVLFNPDNKDSSPRPRLIPPLAPPPRQQESREGRIRCLAFSRGEDHLALGLADGNIQVWDLTSTNPPLEFRGHQDAVLSVAFNPKKDYLASAGADMKVKLWKWNGKDNSWVEVKKPVNKDLFPMFGSSVVSVDFSPDGQLLATGSKDRTAKVFTLEGRLVHAFSHPAGINDVAFSPSKDNKLAVACDDNQWYIHPLNLKEAIALAQRKVTRNLTLEECQNFGIQKGRTPGACLGSKTPLN